MSDVEARVRAFLGQQFPDRAGELATIGPDTPLFERGFLDSLAFLELVHFLEEGYGITVPPADFAPERFATLAAIASYVDAARGPRG